MKIRFIRDILIYMLLPILLFYMSDNSNLSLMIQVVCAIVIMYTIYIKFMENRVNITSLMFTSIFVIYILITKKLSGNDLYFYNTCILLSIGLIIPALRVFDKDISVMVLKDTLTSLNKNSLAMIRLLKKKSIIIEIKRISSIVESNIVLIVLLRMINIIVFKGAPESYLNFLVRLIAIIAFGVVVYKIIKIKNMSKDLKSIDDNQKRSGKGKIINFSNFK